MSSDHTVNGSGVGKLKFSMKNKNGLFVDGEFGHEGEGKGRKLEDAQCQN